MGNIGSGKSTILCKCGVNAYTPPIGATITYADSSKRWMDFIEDSDLFYPSNWIRVGNSEEATNHITTPNAGCVADNWIYQPCHYDDFGLDASEQNYEKLLNGGIAPFKFVGKGPYGNPLVSQVKIRVLHGMSQFKHGLLLLRLFKIPYQ